MSGINTPVPVYVANGSSVRPKYPPQHEVTALVIFNWVIALNIFKLTFFVAI